MVSQMLLKNIFSYDKLKLQEEQQEQQEQQRK
jgi:hypothetical protein